MLPLDVPFVPEGDYPDFLVTHRDALASVHFSLSHPAVTDARQRMGHHPLDALIPGLSLLGDIPKYVLMNTRLHAPEKYFTADHLAATATLLGQLVDRAGIQGVIFADAYFLQALSDAHPALAEQLEAVPSINAMLDSADRTFAMLDMISRTAFKLPGKLILDRSLNRDMVLLNSTSRQLKAAYPAMRLHVIANEGCLLNCPFKPAHDAHIAMVNEGLCGDRTFAMNRDLGCVRRFLEDPRAFLTSPFIRPEDTPRYTGMVDCIKLCGRNKGTDFLKQAITAYIDMSYTGNLLDLMDAMGDLSDRVIIDNQRIPDDFLHRITECHKQCMACTWCSDLARTVVTHVDPGLPRL